MNYQNLQPRNVMPILFIAATILCSPLSSFAQTSIAVAPNKLNVLYIGVDNPVSVAASASRDEKVTVSISGCEGTVTKTAAGLYTVRVSTVTDDCLLNVYADGKLAGASSFRVRHLPRPSATIGGFASGSKLKTDVLKRQAGIGVYLKDFPFEVKYEVVGFTFKIADDKAGVKTVDCQGPLFSSQVKQYMDEYAKPGNMITIDKIWVKDESGKELKIPALVYSIE
ncbi:MAG TPA: GldM family protein [Flavisolibacter sp.]|jgi:hypothetical protein